jgi:hypothetical protein
MPKQRKTRAELEAMIMAEMRHIPLCTGTSGVTVRGLADRRVAATWEISHVHNSTHLCESELAPVYQRLVVLYDLAE